MIPRAGLGLVGFLPCGAVIGAQTVEKGGFLLRKGNCVATPCRDYMNQQVIIQVKAHVGIHSLEILFQGKHSLLTVLAYQLIGVAVYVLQKAVFFLV